MSLSELLGNEQDHLNQKSSSREISVDIITVHGLQEEAQYTWMDAHSGAEWLRTMLPRLVANSRVLNYEYSIKSLLDSRANFAKSLTSDAVTLVQQLAADRYHLGALERPIIFICHGFGGLLVKRALVYSASTSAPKTEHLRSIHVSTMAILFMGTPHRGFSDGFLASRRPFLFEVNKQCLKDLSQGSALLKEITEQFAPLMKRYLIHNFWEQEYTSFDGRVGFVVDRDSATLEYDDIESCGIRSTHSGLVKFKNPQDHGYVVVSAAISRYQSKANGLIKERWRRERQLRTALRQAEASELIAAYDDVNETSTPATQQIVDESIRNQYFFNLRRPDPQFIGRTAHAQLVRDQFGPIAHRSAGEPPTVVVLCGVGGSGKSQFARKFAYDARRKYWGVFWIDASTTETLDSSFAELAWQAGKGGASFSGVHWLSTSTKPWLLVIDNADEPELDLANYMPSSGNGHILITTRNPGVRQLASNGKSGCIKLSGMDPKEAVILLLRSAYPEIEVQTHNDQDVGLAQVLAKQLGYLAIALACAGASIRTRYYTLEEYLRRYLHHRNAIIRLPRACRSGEVDIIGTWELPFRKIVATPAVECRDAADLVHIFAFLHFESIPEKLFKQSWHGLVIPQASLRICPAFLKADESWTEQYQERIAVAIELLYNRSMIDRDPERGICSIHPVVHSWAQDRLEDSEQRHWLNWTVSILAHRISPHMETSGRPDRRLLLPHLDACTKHLQRRFSSFPDSLDKATELDRFAAVYAENGMWKQAKQLQNAVVEFRTKVLGRSHEATLSALRSLSHCLWNLFEIEPAIRIQREILVSRWWHRPAARDWISLRPWKPTYTEYCQGLDDLTLTLWLAGERQWSKYVGERAVRGLRRQLGADDPTTLNAIFNLARTYLHLGEQQLSHKMLVQVVKKRKRLFGFTHPDTLMARNELGMNLCAQKKHLQAAERVVSNVLEARRRLLGEEHAYTLWSVNDLSKVLCEQKRGHEAAKLLEDIVPIVTRTLGEKHVGMTMTRSNLARAYVLCQRWNDAENLLAGLLDVIPSGHPDRINTLSGLVHVKICMGRVDEAEYDCKALIALVETSRSIPKNSPRAIAINEQLLEIYRLQGRQVEMDTIITRMPMLKAPRVTSRFDMQPLRRIPRRESELDRLTS